MKWIPVLIGTLFAFSWPLFMTWWGRRRARLLDTKQPTYAKLKQERDTFFFCFGFLLFWTLMAAPRVDWTFAGEYTGGVVAGAFAITLWIVRWVFWRMDRGKASGQETR
jgi:hypothetical protein